MRLDDVHEDDPLRVDSLNDARRRMVLLCAWVAALAGLAVLAAALAGLPWNLLMGMALAAAVISGLTPVAILRCRSHHSLDRVTAVWELSVLGVLVGTYLVTPGHVAYPTAVVALLSLWVLLPQGLAFRFGLSLALTVILLAVLQLAPEARFDARDAWSFVLANLFGAWFAHRQRLGELQLRAVLDATRRDRDRARLMRQLLPICAWCGKLRDEQGFWYQVEDFVDQADLEVLANSVCERCRTAESRDPDEPEPPSRMARRRATDIPALDRWQALLLTGAAVLFTGGLVLLSPGTNADPVLRYAAVGFSGGTFLVLSFTRHLLVFRALVFLWSLLVSAMFAFTLVVNPAQLTVTAVALAAMALAMVLPLPLPLRVPAVVISIASGIVGVNGAALALSLPLTVQYTAGLCASAFMGLWFAMEREGRDGELREAQREAEAEAELIRRLGALLPICRVCHSVRDEAGYWRSVEEHLAEESGRQLTHGICTSCADEVLSEA